MTTSQNGWPASPDKAAIGIASPKVPGTDVDFPQGIKKGDVTTVLLYVAEQFHAHVEKLHDGTCWGYSYRGIEGSHDLSNHASGTAIDLNADHHSMGVHGTFTTTQVAQIRKILNFCEGTVRWGGDYNGRVDEMHFEINADAAHVARVAAKIHALTATPPANPAAHVVKVGDEGMEVRHIQQFLVDVFPIYRFNVDVKTGHLLTVDDEFGPQTEAWVKEFQLRTHIDNDGVVGPVTFKKLREYGYKY